MNNDSDTLKELIIKLLEDKKAFAISSFHTADAIAEHIILANGTSTRNVASISAYISQELKNQTDRNIKIDGANSDWVVIDTGDILCHVFKETIREYYNIDELYIESKR